MSAITASRSTKGGWTVHEFDSGRRLLALTGPSVNFTAHFTAEEWAEFQKLIAGANDE